MTQDVSGAPALVPVLLNESFPTYVSGRCPKCAGFVLAQPGITTTWDSNEVLECPTDAAKFSRLTYIKEALPRLDTIAFALFASDRWIGAQADLTPGEVISYSLPTEGVKSGSITRRNEPVGTLLPCHGPKCRSLIPQPHLWPCFSSSLPQAASSAIITKKRSLRRGIGSGCLSWTLSRMASNAVPRRAQRNNDTSCLDRPHRHSVRGILHRSDVDLLARGRESYFCLQSRYAESPLGSEPCALDARASSEAPV